MEFEERHQPGNVPDPHEHGNKYGDLSMSGNAQAFLGNAYFYSTGSADRQEDREQELLFKSLYYGQMDDRKTDVTTAKVQTCQWIWSTIFRRWLRAHQPKAFWIAGKPGSGKSTLMKYLASSTDVVSNLPDHRPGWLVVSFFFDFRLADEVGNSVTGLLRSLLFQIIDALPQTANSKDVRNSVLQRLHGHWRQSRTPSTDQLTEAFQDVIHTSDQNIFVLVDGLDEFTGNPVPLLEFLLSLRRYRSLKICLASRPESEIREILGVLPNIHMSEHNEVGMQQYISLKIQRFQPRLDMLKLLNIQGTLVEKSQGVFLRVHLALEEVLQAGLRGATAPEIKQALASFPVELHTLYQRILARIPLGRRLEAAMMYMLISSATFQVTVALLRSTMRFVILQLGLYDFLADILDEEHFLRRFHATVGGLLELAPLSERLYADFEDYEAGSLRIRLIHETVRSFTRRSQWTDMFIPKNFKQLFPNNFWQRIGSKALLVGNIRTIGVSTSILSSVHGQHKNFTEFSNIIQHNSKDDMLRSLIPLIHHSIRFLPVIFETGRRQAEHDQLRAELPGIMRCRLASMHFALVGAHYGDGVRFPGASLAHEVSDLMIAAGHRNFTYVHENMHRIRQLQDHQRDDIVMAAIFSCRRWGSACVTDDLQQYDEEQSSLHHTVDVILSINNHYHSFHLAIFLILGFAGSARYILKMQDQFASRSRRAWEPVRVPRWNLKNGIGPLFPSADPLCLWACEYDAYPQQSNDRSARLQY
ncbi:hypothetical protein OHC33_003649 [Knufia fluminis]|uniref:NACHT domain-containing protein n=1 Tax=Knufia fluminis TaxID=191047 RepID=A0AAN8EIU6_9EURO|nr:hypothetical protein OHC33_003649 [Knufia fluminis]